MIIVLLMCVFMCWFAFKKLPSDLAGVKNAALATECHCDMERKIFQMQEDSCTTREDWLEILPVARWADEWWFSTHPGMNNSSLEKWVFYFMGDSVTK